MNPDPRTSSNPTLTRNALGCLFQGLGLGVDARCAVTRACRKLSQGNGRGTMSSSFSPYNQGAAPTLWSLKRELDDPKSPVHQRLTRNEVKACRTFVLVREAVGTIPHQEHRQTSPHRGGALHNWGGLNPTSHQPSRRGGW